MLDYFSPNRKAAFLIQEGNELVQVHLKKYQQSQVTWLLKAGTNYGLFIYSFLGPLIRLLAISSIN